MSLRKARFFHQLSEYLEAGLDWNYIISNSDSYYSQFLIIDSIQKSFAKHPRLNKQERVLILAGLRGGNLPQILNDLTEEIETNNKIKKLTIFKLLYPTFLLFIILFVYPIINYPTTGLTGYLTSIYYNFMGIIISSSILYVIFSFTNISYYTPLLSKYLYLKELYHISQMLSLQIKSGINILTAWNNVKQFSKHPKLNNVINNIIRSLNQNQPASVSFNKSLPNDFITLYKTGEKTGHLDTDLAKAAKLYKSKSLSTLNICAIVLSSGIMLIIGGIIIYKVISFYIGYFSQFDAILN